MKTKTIVWLVVVILIVGFSIFVKALGSSSITEDVEKNGYCKFALGENYEYNERQELCSNGQEKVTFTEREFRQICPENSFFSSRFYSKCFFKGDAF